MEEVNTNCVCLRRKSFVCSHSSCGYKIIDSSDVMSSCCNNSCKCSNNSCSYGSNNSSKYSSNNSRSIYGSNTSTALALALAMMLLQSPRGCSCVQIEKVIVPKMVQAGQSVHLTCHYNLDGAGLYSLTWWKGNHQFYQYSADNTAGPTVYVAPGLHVDTALSNETVVVLRNVSLDSAGRYKCEVLTESFEKDMQFATMSVAEVPAEKPSMWLSRHHWRVGEMLVARCSVTGGQPPPSLAWYINGIKVPSELVRRLPADFMSTPTQTAYEYSNHNHNSNYDDRNDNYNSNYDSRSNHYKKPDYYNVHKGGNSYNVYGNYYPTPESRVSNEPYFNPAFGQDREASSDYQHSQPSLRVDQKSNNRLYPEHPFDSVPYRVKRSSGRIGANDHSISNNIQSDGLRRTRANNSEIHERSRSIQSNKAAEIHEENDANTRAVGVVEASVHSTPSFNGRERSENANLKPSTSFKSDSNLPNSGAYTVKNLALILPNQINDTASATRNLTLLGSIDYKSQYLHRSQIKASGEPKSDLYVHKVRLHSPGYPSPESSTASSQMTIRGQKSSLGTNNAFTNVIFPFVHERPPQDNLPNSHGKKENDVSKPTHEMSLARDTHPGFPVADHNSDPLAAVGTEGHRSEVYSRPKPGPQGAPVRKRSATGIENRSLRDQFGSYHTDRGGGAGTKPSDKVQIVELKLPLRRDHFEDPGVARLVCAAEMPGIHYSIKSEKVISKPGIPTASPSHRLSLAPTTAAPPPRSLGVLLAFVLLFSH